MAHPSGTPYTSGTSYASGITTIGGDYESSGTTGVTSGTIGM